ncbi:MAG: Nif3-like dinuclear metal center hexameric protein [candidate division WOR-3 bacterium]|nr:MAG: Nif3-like dinuclear metal center hexameric protein [candidate division WOR-3 bacterium]
MDERRWTIELAEIVNELDTFFQLAKWPADPAMKEWVPKTYARADFDFEDVFEAQFCNKFNGLMLKAGSMVKHVFCSAFATPDVLNNILGSGIYDALLFTHHPLDMEVCGAGFLPIPLSSTKKFQQRRISIYSCHAPLDCHDEIGTNAAIVEALGVTVDKHYIEYGTGYAGRIGTVEQVGTDSLLKRITGIFGVSRLEVGGCLNTEVGRIAIVAGGGDEIDYLKQAHECSCDMYLSGEWYPRYSPEAEGGKERVARARQEIADFSGKTRMVLVGVSHAASEYLVMKTQMKRYFEEKGLPTEPVPQSNWWR